MPLIARQFRCVGKVQGVFFRASTKERAIMLGVKGWVKNESNGDVSVHAEGMDEMVSALYEWCQEGPPLARVEEVKETEVSIENFDSFEVRYF